jgi:hypothetical protein
LLQQCDKILSGFTLAALDDMDGDSQRAQEVDAEQLLLLQSPHFIQGVGLMVALTACADVVTAHAAASHLSSGSGSGDGSSNDGSSGSMAVCGSNSSSTGGSCSNDGSSTGHGSSNSAAWMSGVTASRN